MSKWLDFEETEEGIFINLSQFSKKQATGKMFCLCCSKVVKAYPPGACNANRRKSAEFLIAPRWLRLRLFCSKCGWMFKRNEIPAAVKRAAAELDGGQCVYCGVEESLGVPMEHDHVKPQLMGGGETVENIVQVCFECNASKGTKTKWIKPRFGRFSK